MWCNGIWCSFFFFNKKCSYFCKWFPFLFPWYRYHLIFCFHYVVVVSNVHSKNINKWHSRKLWWVVTIVYLEASSDCHSFIFSLKFRSEIFMHSCAFRKLRSDFSCISAREELVINIKTTIWNRSKCIVTVKHNRKNIREKKRSIHQTQTEWWQFQRQNTKHDQETKTKQIHFTSADKMWKLDWTCTTKSRQNSVHECSHKK